MFELRPIQQHARFNSSTIAILLILMAAFALRVYDLDWDEGHYLHPDERFVADVITNRIIFKMAARLRQLARSRALSAESSVRKSRHWNSPRFCVRFIATICYRPRGDAFESHDGNDWSSNFGNIYKVDSCPRFSTR